MSLRRYGITGLRGSTVHIAKTETMSYCANSLYLTFENPKLIDRSRRYCRRCIIIFGDSFMPQEEQQYWHGDGFPFKRGIVFEG